MAISNRDRVSKAIDLLVLGLRPFIEREVRSTPGQEPLDRRLPGSQSQDLAGLLRLMVQEWNLVFRRTLGRTERSYVSELQEIRIAWAHNEPFSYADTYRAADTAARLLRSVSAKEAEEVEAIATEVQRVQFDEQVRSRTRTRTRGRNGPGEGRQQALDTSIVIPSGLKPWREVVEPHRDVQSGRFAQAQFAADFAQILSGKADSAYGDPREFFSRTHLTRGIRDLLTSALQRLSGQGGDPVAELQTNFGGGKTHSMIALYHLFGGSKPTELPQIEDFLKEQGADSLPRAHRAVLVGTNLNPGEPWRKDDGTVIHTLWGEMAYQLGGPAGYERVRANDVNGTAPGSNLLAELFTEYAPALVLIDEWVAFTRQTYGKTDLPGGTFDSNMTFAQALTEAASNTADTMVVASLPVSDRGDDGDGLSHGDEIEVGGTAGRLALESLSEFFQRKAVQWTPASPEESFEIVRRRLFEPLTTQEQFTNRDAVVRSFSALYEKNQAEFPSRAGQASYTRLLELSYPVHPALFTLLYESWGSLERFQRTRGVLRLMAAVIHELWERNDAGLMILSGFIPMDVDSVVSELTRYLEDNWRPVISQDVDGPESLPLALDRENGNFGRYSAARRVARVLYMGSAPVQNVAQGRGLEDREVKLGAVQPGETPATFGDALRRLSDRATHLYSDGSRYWYGTQPSIAQEARDRADRLRNDADTVHEEIKRRLRDEQRRRGEFARVFPAPGGTGDVDDAPESGLAILSPDSPHAGRNADGEARARAIEFLQNRGNSPRHCKNALVFLAADKTRLAELEEAVRLYLAWSSIQRDQENDQINLDNFQANQVRSHAQSADEAVEHRVKETYIWLLVPAQPDPTGPIEWLEYRLSGQDGLAVRASKKLVTEDRLRTQFAGTLLRMELDRVLWKDRPDHIPVRQLRDYFANHVYLPRLRDERVLYEAVSDGMSRMIWAEEGFGYADGWDDDRQRYMGLHAGPENRVPPDAVANGLVVKASAVQAHFELVAAEAGKPKPDDDGAGGKPGIVKEPPVPAPPRYTRFHGSKRVSADRLAVEAATIGDEVVKYLQGQLHANVEITIDIHAVLPDGVPDDIVRTVTENVSTLRFDDDSGFEEE